MFQKFSIYEIISGTGLILSINNKHEIVRMDGESEDFPDEIEMKNVSNLKYASVASVYVEHSFYAFKLILIDKRHSLIMNNFRKLLLYCRANCERMCCGYTYRYILFLLFVLFSYLMMAMYDQISHI